MVRGFRPAFSSPHPRVDILFTGCHTRWLQQLNTMICSCFKEKIFDCWVNHCILFSLVDSLTSKEQFEGKEKLTFQEILCWKRTGKQFNKALKKHRWKSQVKYYLELCKPTESRKSERWKQKHVTQSIVFSSMSSESQSSAKGLKDATSSRIDGCSLEY